LELRIRHLERLAAVQSKRLGSMREELTGDSGVDDPPSSVPAVGESALSTRIKALERGLADRNIIAEELIKSAKMAVAHATAELQEGTAKCDSTCACVDHHNTL